MSARRTNEVLSLAGVLQAAALVDQLAFSGKPAPRECLQASIKSVTIANQDSVEEMFGALAKLQVGLDNLEKYLSRDFGQSFANRVKYMNQLNRLGSFMSRQSELAASISTALAPEVLVRHQKSQKSLIKYLAKVYYNNFSQLSKNLRIVVVGKKEFLQQEENVETIRALLFAGIRASLLWRMHGGNKLSLLLGRIPLLTEVQRLQKRLAEDV